MSFEGGLQIGGEGIDRGLHTESTSDLRGCDKKFSMNYKIWAPVAGGLAAGNVNRRWRCAVRKSMPARMAAISAGVTSTRSP